VDGQQVTYVLYKPGERDRERTNVAKIHDKSSPEACIRGTGTSPDGRRGEYIEYTYRAGDDGKWFVALWWDDGQSNPTGSAVLTMRTPWDETPTDPARPLRDKFVAWGYKFTEN
jgi:hypothetical protein